MGNSNSGNRGGRRTTDQMHALDVRKMQRAGLFSPGQSAFQSVRLAWTPCHYGGQRPWLLCPVTGCGRRVAVLYAGSVLACRHCHQLAYKSQRQTSLGRAYRRANKLRERLGWVPGVIHGPGEKPKGMHWATFLRLHVKHDDATVEALGGATERLDKLTAVLERMMATRRA